MKTALNAELASGNAKTEFTNRTPLNLMLLIPTAVLTAAEDAKSFALQMRSTMWEIRENRQPLIAAVLAIK
jgi:hypothetical protein